MENKFMVSVQGEDIVILKFQRRMTKEEALNMAAWLVALASPSGEQWEKTLEAVLES